MSSISQRTYGGDEPFIKDVFTRQLISYLLHLADDALILSHRNSEWCGHGPMLELDIALTNIALDLLGQARSFYQYAAELCNSHKGLCQGITSPCTEDTFAYHRDASQFNNCQLVEQPKGDWGFTITRQFLFSTYQYYLYNTLQTCNNQHIAAIAARALKEVTYHVRWSSEWVVRLGAGTAESHGRMLAALNAVKPFLTELFIPADYEAETAKAGTGADVASLQMPWQQKVQEIFTQAALQQTLPLPAGPATAPGKNGQHTQHLTQLLAEMQYLQRTNPGAEW